MVLPNVQAAYFVSALLYHGKDKLVSLLPQTPPSHLKSVAKVLCSAINRTAKGREQLGINKYLTYHFKT